MCSKEVDIQIHNNKIINEVEIDNNVKNNTKLSQLSPDQIIISTQVVETDNDMFECCDEKIDILTI